MDVADQIIKVIDKLSEKFGIAVNATQPSLEKLAHKIVNYELYLSILYTMIDIGLLAVLLIIAYKFLKKLNLDKQLLEKGRKNEMESSAYPWRRDKYDIDIHEIENQKIVTSIGVLVLSMVLFGFMLSDISGIVKCKLLPEQVVLEYVTDQYEKLK